MVAPTERSVASPQSFTRCDRAPSHEREADHARHDHGNVEDTSDLLEHHHCTGEVQDRDHVTETVLDMVVKLKNNSSIQLRCSSGPMAAVKLTG